MKIKKQIPMFLLSIILIFIVLFNPRVVSEGAIYGLNVCANVIIPSLFPFCVICIFIIKSKCLYFLEKSVSPLSFKLFGIPPCAFFAMFFSFLGGYPVGAKSIVVLRKENKISDKCASIMLYYCINAGPAFIIIAVGTKILNSNTAGILLLCAHILASIVIALIAGRFIKEKENRQMEKETSILNISDIFVESTADSCASIISICSYVVLFSTLINIVKSFEIEFFTYGLCPLLEVTTGVMGTRNIYLISALLGWGGFCVHFQIFSVCKILSFNKLYFFISRIIHSLLSVIILFILLKIFPISIQTMTNNINFTNSFSTLTYGASISLILSGIVLVASVGNRKY